MSTFKVGAGRALIEYTEEMFPNFGEFYTGIHDDSYAQVIILEQDVQYALVALGIVLSSEPEIIAQHVSKAIGIPAENVIVHAKHVLSGPHARRDEKPEQMLEMAKRRGMEVTAEEAVAYAERNALICDAMIAASVAAAKVAKASVVPATMNYSVGYTDIIVNRLVKTDKGWWQGHNPDGSADGSLPVLRFDDLKGNSIAMLFFCNVAPGVLEFSKLADGSRPASGDIAAETERRLDSAFDGVVSVYLTAATGDHWQALRAMHDTIDRNGHQTVTDLHETGFVFIDIIADRLKEAVTRASEKTEVQGTDGLAFDRFTFRYPGQKVEGARMGQPSTDAVYIENGEQPLGLDVLRIGNDTAILFVGVELNGGTWKIIKENSPFKNTMIVGFANKHGGGYLPEKDYYDKITYQSLKTRYFGGTAELFAQDIIKVLKDLKG